MIPLVKVLWKNHEREAATWEPEAQMRHLLHSFEFSLFLSRTKCSKGGRICNALFREGVRYV